MLIIIKSSQNKKKKKKMLLIIKKLTLLYALHVIVRKYVAYAKIIQKTYLV